MANHLEILKQLNDMEVEEKKVLPDRRRIVSIIKLIQLVLFPNYYQYKGYSQEEAWEVLNDSLLKELKAALSVDHEKADELKESVLSELPNIKKKLLTDIQAIYDGDPAAKTKSEVILCYPGFYAITIYRIAHVLYEKNISFIPRIMTEYAHEKTGIDINPGATIGDYFCIDHGTGIVIGETATIGEHVKLYQGVTIGAKSFDLDENGNPKKSGKRHPDIGNYVIIYANVTILGGDTKIGDHCIVGGNTWLVHSLEDGSKVTKKELPEQL
jgi:serine O-acetyltransferase